MIDISSHEKGVWSLLKLNDYNYTRFKEQSDQYLFLCDVNPRGLNHFHILQDVGQNYAFMRRECYSYFNQKYKIKFGCIQLCNNR